MSTISLGQAVRNAVEVERSAARFYKLLADSTQNAEARTFLQTMEEEEHQHARAILEMGTELTGGALPMRADHPVELVETAPAWRWEDGLTLAQAMHVALEAEEHAQLYYDAVAGCSTGKVKDFFAGLARAEQKHIDRVKQWIAQSK